MAEISKLRPAVSASGMTAAAEAATTRKNPDGAKVVELSQVLIEYARIAGRREQIPVRPARFFGTPKMVPLALLQARLPPSINAAIRDAVAQMGIRGARAEKMVYALTKVMSERPEYTDLT